MATNRHDDRTGLITVGLNGSGRLVSEIANHAALVLASRLMALFGVPVVMWLFVEIWNGQQEIGKGVHDNLTANAVQTQQLAEHQRRLNRIERQITP